MLVGCSYCLPPLQPPPLHLEVPYWLRQKHLDKKYKCSDPRFRIFFPIPFYNLFFTGDLMSIKWAHRDPTFAAQSPPPFEMD